MPSKTARRRRRGPKPFRPRGGPLTELEIKRRRDALRNALKPEYLTNGR